MAFERCKWTGRFGLRGRLPARAPVPRQPSGQVARAGRPEGKIPRQGCGALTDCHELLPFLVGADQQKRETRLPGGALQLAGEMTHLSWRCDIEGANKAETGLLVLPVCFQDLLGEPFF